MAKSTPQTESEDFPFFKNEIKILRRPWTSRWIPPTLPGWPIPKSVTMSTSEK